jgi:ubiquinone/menaquinone biosynthesis C-methylase UbiE
MEADSNACSACGHTYSTILGIPDLCPPGLEPSPEEEAVVERLCEMYPTATADELGSERLSMLFALSGSICEEQRQNVIQYGKDKHSRAQQFRAAFERSLDRYIATPRRGSVCDLGCGTGAGLVTLAADYQQVVGLDISMSALIVAKKLTETYGLTNCTLVRGTALSLPFADGLFDFCMAINVLEHILEPLTMLSEIHRVMVTGGIFAGDSRNRFDPFFPEPHVKLRWVGFLPREWQKPYVRWRKGLEYEHIRLLSYRDLKRALTKSFGSEWHITMPDTSVYDAPASLQRVVEKVDRVPLLHPFLIRMSPSHWVLAQRVN